MLILAMLGGIWMLRAVTIEPCPWPIIANTMETLDAEQYKGTWYEFYRNVENTFEKGDCVRAIYGDNKGERRVTVINSQLFGEKGS